VTTPNGWSITRIGEVAKINSHKLSSNSDPDHEYYYIDLSAVDKGTITMPQERQRFIDLPSRARRVLHKNDVIMATVRPNLLGFAFYDHEPKDVLCSTGFALLSPKNPSDSHFIYHSLYSDLTLRQLHGLVTGSNYPAINASEVKRLKLMWPTSPAERQRIGTILDAWDQAITFINQRIRVSQQRKKGLLQRLLTGRARFPEFDGDEWETDKLTNVSTRIRRKNTKETPNILSITADVGFEHQIDKFGRVIAGKNISNYTLLKRGEFAYNKGNSLSYPQGCIYLLEEYDEAAVPNVYYCFRLDSARLYAPFYKYYFESGALNAQLMRVINTGVRNDGLLNLHADDFFDCRISIPPIAEQHRIATIFRACDREIKLLEQKRDALQRQKKGLMQRLLTGRVRVTI
jgi:type I restriction enzyme S subunit